MLSIFQVWNLQNVLITFILPKQHCTDVPGSQVAIRTDPCCCDEMQRPTNITDKILLSKLGLLAGTFSHSTGTDTFWNETKNLPCYILVLRENF